MSGGAAPKCNRRLLLRALQRQRRLHALPELQLDAYLSAQANVEAHRRVLAELERNFKAMAPPRSMRIVEAQTTDQLHRPTEDAQYLGLGSARTPQGQSVVVLILGRD